MKRIFTTLALAAPAASLAASNVSLASDVFVEKIERDAQGRPVTRLSPPRALTAGDALVFILSYRNRGAVPASGFVVTNPVPDGVAFRAAESPDAEVSVDGGRAWGRLGSLVVAGPDGRPRPAAAADVTHIRWSVKDIVAPGATGQLSYRATAR